MKRMMLYAVMAAVLFNGMAYARTYKIGMTAWTGCSPNNVAEAKGFWKSRGMDVQVITLASNQELHNAFVNRRIDIGHEMIGTWVGLHNDGIPVTILTEFDWCHGGDKIIAKNGFDAGSLKGQVIGLYWNQAPVLFFLNKYLESKAIRLSDVRPVEIDAEGLTANFLAGRFPVILNYDPHAIVAEKQGNGKILASTASYPGCMPGGYAVMTESLKTIPKEDLVKIFKGWMEAVTWVKDGKNWEEYKKILNTGTFEGEKPHSDGELKEMLDAVRIHDKDILTERNKDGGGLSVWLTEMKTMLKENSMLKKDFNPEEIFDNAAIKEALK